MPIVTQAWLPLLRYIKSQKCFSYDDLIAVLERLFITLNQPPSTINKSSISRSQILDEVIPFRVHDPRVLTRDFCFRIVVVEIDVGKNSPVSVPSSNLYVVVAQRKLFAGGTSTLNHQLCMRFTTDG